MAAPKGHKRYGGRAKGTPNAGTLPLEAKAKELGIDPFEVLLHFAKGDWRALGYAQEQAPSSYSEHGTVYKYTIDPAVRSKAAQEACHYLYSKRQAISVDVNEDPEMIEAVKSFAVLSKEELLAVIAQEMRKLK